MTEHKLNKFEIEQVVTIPPEQREAFMLQGGTPHLDDKYTIFGEVVSGMKVVEKMELTGTDPKDRPLKNIKIKSMKIVTK